MLSTSLCFMSLCSILCPICVYNKLKINRYCRIHSCVILTCCSCDILCVFWTKTISYSSYVCVSMYTFNVHSKNMDIYSRHKLAQHKKYSHLCVCVLVTFTKMYFKTDLTFIVHMKLPTISGKLIFLLYFV